jgi:hypothetical protein
MTSKGTCQCGAVHYTVDAPFLYAGYCHCSNCRRTTGSAFSAVAGAPLQALRVTKGEDCLTNYARNDNGVRCFCKICGCSLFVLRPNAGLVHVRLGTLDDHSDMVKPSAHIFVGSKAPWYDITDSLPQFQEAPPMAAP